jgi:hypothetical protein
MSELSCSPSAQVRGCWQYSNGIANQDTAMATKLFIVSLHDARVRVVDQFFRGILIMLSLQTIGFSA